MNNAEYYKSIQAAALSSCYWCREVIRYLMCDYYDYAPMISDGLFKAFFNERDIVGTAEIEKALGRRLTVEELKPCVLSVAYLLSDHPIITESEGERLRLQEFERIINDKIREQENRTRTRIRKTL